VAFEMPAPCHHDAHFHAVDQFQLFLPGAGTWFQRHDVAALTVHYTDAYVVYGPFGAKGPEPLRFFTLRARSVSLTGYLPDDRELLVRRGRRNRSQEVDLSDGAPAGCSVVIAPEPDGLAAYLLKAAPGEQVVSPEPAAGSAGEFLVVAKGSAVVDGRRLASRSVVWHDPGEPCAVVTGDDGGCVVLALQFPAPTT
jgi:hypothetical protein